MAREAAGVAEHASAAPRGLSVPQGFTDEAFGDLSASVRRGAGHLSDDIAVHGSRASGNAQVSADIDIVILVSPEQFEELIRTRFGTPNPGSAKERTMLHAVEAGKIQAGEAGLRDLRKSLEAETGLPVDISIIRIGGAFDQGPYIPLR